MSDEKRPIEVQQDRDNEESSFRFTIVAPHLPAREAEGRYPYKPHIKSGDAVESFTEAASKGHSSRDHSSYVRMEEEIQECTPEMIEKAAKKVQESISGFLCALGLCIAISSEEGYENTNPVHNIHNASELIGITFSNLGYATLKIRNPSKMQLLAIFQALAVCVKYPTSYSRLFIYYTGHGAKSNLISLRDGYVSISTLKTMLWRERAPKLGEMPKVLIFDCCRGNIDGKSDLHVRALLPIEYVAESSDSQYEPARNILTLFSTPPLCKTYAAKDGIGFTTAALVKLLEKTKSRSLTDIFHSELLKSVRSDVEGLQECDLMCPLVDGVLNDNINVYEEKMKAMKPKDVKFAENGEQCRISWTPPPHAAHHKLQKYMLAKKRPRADDWEKSEIRGGSSVTYVDVNKSEIAGYELAIVGCYAEPVGVSSDGVSSDVTWLENVDVAPRNVRVNKADDGLTFFWEKSVNGDLFSPVGFKIYRRGKNSTRDSDWMVASSDIAAEERHCTIPMDSLDTNVFKVEAIYKDGKQAGSIATPNPNQQEKGTSKKCVMCIAIAIVAIVMLILVLIALIAVVIVLLRSVVPIKPHFNQYAEDQDLVDCDVLPFENSRLYSEIAITEVVTSGKNDSKKVPVSVFSVDKKKLEYNTSHVSLSFTKSLNESSRFIISSNDQNRSLYMRPKSNITSETVIQGSPTKATVYIIKGEKNAYDFIEDPTSVPHYDDKIDIIGASVKSKTVTIENSDYYYVAVDIATDEAIEFTCNISFFIIYINGNNDYLQDLLFTNSQQIKEVGDRIHVPLDQEGRNVTLCYIHDPRSTNGTNITPQHVHLNIEYQPRVTLYVIYVAVILLPIIVFIIIIVLLVLCLCYMCKNRSRLCCTTHPHHYEPINTDDT